MSAGHHSDILLWILTTARTADVSGCCFYPDHHKFAYISLSVYEFYHPIGGCWHIYTILSGGFRAHKVREMDRRRNVHRYPIVDYAEMYLLDRGYSKFFKEHNFVVSSFIHINMQICIISRYLHRNFHDGISRSIAIRPPMYRWRINDMQTSCDSWKRSLNHLTV
jgi:hypothetical protein